jgi:hypothetical protein
MSSPTFESLPLKITCGLRYHDYYNSIAHGAKASLVSVSIVVIQDNQATTYENTSSIELVITNFSTTSLLAIEIKAVPSDPKISVVVRPVILSVTDLLEGKIHIPFDFSYPKDGIKHPITHYQRELMSSIVAHEHGNGPTEAKRAVASVIFNRSHNTRYDYTTIMLQKNAFTTIRLINTQTGRSYTRDTDGQYKSCKDAVDYVSMYGVTIPKSVYFFKSITKDGTFFPNYPRYKQIGALYFSHNPKYM